MVSVSDTPWSDFDESDFTPEQWYRSCLIHLGESEDPYTKSDCKLPVREPDGTLNRNAVHAAARRLPETHASADLKRKAARKLIALYDQIGDEPPDSLIEASRSTAGGYQEILRYERVWPLDDIVIRSGGDGRTVEAYAAIFETPYEVRDQHGHYLERIERSAFNKTLADTGPTRAMCLYNHGMTVHGQPDAILSVPLGKPLEIRPDGKGLLTITRYNRSTLADSVLESIRNGDITSQSFRGRIVRSTPPRGPYRSMPGRMVTVTRHELGLSDYGPTPTAVNKEPMMVAVRSTAELAAELASLDDHAREELIRALNASDQLDESATPEPGAGTEEPPTGHSGRHVIARALARVASIDMERTHRG